jgi:hypothetical protein
MRTKETFVVRQLWRAQELPNSSPSRDRCLDVLRKWIQGMGPSALGFDFPFGLPQTLMGGQDWRDFVTGFADRFRSAESFADWCRRKACGKELKRTTDEAARTPFSVYNLRMFRQTYWGIASVLGPLVADDRVSVLPMQQPVPGRPHLLETCPASTLKRLGLYTPYKGRELRHRRERKAIVAALDDAGLATVPADLTDVIVGDTGGDALDAVIAGVATTAAVTHPDFPRIAWRDEYALEACVYT